MKVLIVSPCATHPPVEGNRRRILSLADVLIDCGHEVHLALLPNHKFETGDLQLTRAHWHHRLHLLYPNQGWDPGFRVRRKLAGLGNRILRRGAGLPPQSQPIPSVDDAYLDWWDTRLIMLQRRHGFDAVMVEYVFFSRCLECFPPPVLRIIDTHDLFTGRDAVIAQRLQRPSAWLSTAAGAEQAGLERADVVIGIQTEETAKLNELVPGKAVTIGHFFTVPDALAPGENHPPTVTFVGSANAINVDACEWFIDQVLPQVRRAAPGTRLRVVGGVGQQLAERWRTHEGVQIVGRVDDLTDEYRLADVVINPVRFGTGLAIKSIEALAFGKPLVCTPDGARGISLPGLATPPCTIATGTTALADAVSGLLLDPGKRAAQASAARTFIAQWNAHQRAQLIQVFS